MKKSKRLEPIVKLAENDEMNAARALGECQNRLNAHQARLSQLVSYRRDYVERMQRQGLAGMMVSQMQSYQRIIAQLEHGINEQTRIVENARTELEKMKNRWFESRTRTQSMDMVHGQYIRQERMHDQRREQKECDERAQRMGLSVSL